MAPDTNSGRIQPRPAISLVPRRNPTRVLERRISVSEHVISGLSRVEVHDCWPSTMAGAFVLDAARETGESSCSVRRQCRGDETATVLVVRFQPINGSLQNFAIGTVYCHASFIGNW